jgi:PAS domain S-box-containing protein
MTVLPHVDDDLRALLSRASAGAFVGGENRRIVLWNRAATSITGYSAMEALGRTCCDLFGKHANGDDCVHERAAVMTLSETTVGAFDVHTMSKAGRPLWLHLTVFPVRA